METEAPTGVLKNRIYSLVPKSFTGDLKKAIAYAEEKYKNSYRYNNEPMINHTLRIAISLLEEGLDLNTTFATLFHEMTLDEKTRKEITKEFGVDVLNILDGITKIRRGTNSEDTNPEIIIKYILNSSKDLRPVYLKIYDTLHDVLSFDEIPENEKKSKLYKAINIYAKLAEYLHLEKLRAQLEEISFKYYLPLEYQSITNKMGILGISPELQKRYEEVIKECIKESKVKPEIQGRIKNKYSIYKKLKKYEKEWIDPNIRRLDDLIAFRIMASNEDSCYLVIEKLMDKGEINEERYDDYISNPKPNGYRAVQFPIRFPEISDMFVEIQILTEEMYYENTFGKASHIAYKASKSRFAKPTNKYDWVKDIQDEITQSRKETRTTKSYPIKCNIFEDEVFPFTPKGKIIPLNKGDTVLDFAFKLHTDIGNSMESAKVNGKPAKLGQELETGDVVEIRVDKNKTHQKDATLEYANSPTTKNKIRKNLKIGVK
ncbi:MAG: HD domain-containing protein [Candidatus Dojkabacteria bacterium]|jgi:guanosine-3',5'-bis(diphosphate) 3'-pyrophosphohydrolase